MFVLLLTEMPVMIVYRRAFTLGAPQYKHAFISFFIYCKMSFLCFLWI